MTICEDDTFVWNVNNVTYNGSAGNQSITIEGADCAADQTLNITVTPKPDADVTDMTICEDDTFVWNVNNVTYNGSAGNQSITIEGADCAADQTLNITVTAEPAADVTDVTIYSYETYKWDENNVTYNGTSGDQTITIEGTNCAADQILNITVVCANASNTTVTTSISEDETKTLSGSPDGGTWLIVSGGGTIDGNTYTPDDINTDTLVEISYSFAADAICPESSSIITFTVNPVCLTATNTTATASITDLETKTLTATPDGGTWSMVSMGGTITGNVFTPDSVNADTDVTIRYTIAADGDCAISTADVTFTVTPGIDPCTVGATVGVVTANDPDADGINNECDLDDDNDGILDTEECEVILAETPFSVSNGNSVNFDLSPVGNGFVLDVTRMDNSFNLMINGTPLTTQEVQFQQNGTPTGQNIRFKDGSIWGQGGIPQIYQFGNSVSEETPIVRFIIDENLDIKMYASKVANGPLFELELFNGNSFNNFTWNSNSANNFVLSQVVTGQTYINGRVYGTVMNCDIDDDGIRNSEDLDSDGDGCYDVVESGGVDANNDGILDGNGLDSEGRITNGSGGYNGLDGNEWIAHQMNITSSPSNLTKTDGDTATFSIVTSAEEATSYNAGTPVFGTPGNANGGIIYQWYLGDPNNGGTILSEDTLYTGTNTADLYISNVTGLNANVYYVKVTHTNNVCSEEIKSATLSVEILGSIGDTVWYDSNEDGSNAGENGLEGATVTLDPGTPNNQNDDVTTTTDANGEYLFDKLPSGSYTITVDVSTVTSGIPSGKTPADLIQTYDDDSVGTANNSTINLAQGENNLNQDFGYVASDGLGSIGDLVWFDTDGDGIKDSNENGLEGATVTLDPGTPGNPNDDVVMVTDANGNYLFTDLPSGPYTISVDVSTVTGGLPNNVTVADLIQTFDYDSVGTPNNSTINLAQGENNLDQDFAYGITSGNTGGGNSGGVESESLGDAISKIYVGRKKNSVPTEFVKSSENLYNKKKMKSVQPYQGKGQTLLDMFPEQLYAGNVANVTSPTDILDYTVADEVLSVDFSVNGKTKGVVLGIKTTDKIYNHTKASCDRLRGAEILNIQKIQIEGYNFLMQGIKQRNGIVEYAVSFATAKNNNDSNYTIQTNWYVNEYTKFNDVYNFQVWSTKPDDTKKLVKDVIENLKSFIPVKQTETQKFPETYASKIYREKGELIVALRSTEEGNTADISMVELYSETANNIKHRNNSISTEIQQDLRLDIADGYEYDGLVKVDGNVEDAFYHADGNWGLDYDKTYTEVKNYFVWNDFDREYLDDEYTINRSVELKATSDYDYISVYKSLLPGTISADYSEYNYLSFTAKGSGLMELGLIKSSIEDWKAQYRVMVDFSEEEQTYYVPFDIFASSATQEKMTAEDLTTLIFTFLPVEANTTELDLVISDVKFTKTAVEDQIVNKIETFENEFMAYPNPSKGNVNLLLFSESDTEATITLSDITGKIIYRGKAQLNKGKNELDYNFKVKTGVMLLQVTSQETDYGTSKIIFR